MGEQLTVLINNNLVRGESKSITTPSGAKAKFEKNKVKDLQNKQMTAGNETYYGFILSSNSQYAKQENDTITIAVSTNFV